MMQDSKIIFDKYGSNQRRRIREIMQPLAAQSTPSLRPLDDRITAFATILLAEANESLMAYDARDDGMPVIGRAPRWSLAAGGQIVELARMLGIKTEQDGECWKIVSSFSESAMCCDFDTDLASNTIPLDTDMAQATNDGFL